MDNWTRYEIIPMPKPRQTRRDQWKKRPAVLRYRAFCDHVRLAGVKVPESGAHVVFWVPMPDSWSQKKRSAMLYKPHTQRPDLDNYVKALLDGCYAEDSTVWRLSAEKRWHTRGLIDICPRYDWPSAVSYQQQLDMAEGQGRLAL